MANSDSFFTINLMQSASPFSNIFRASLKYTTAFGYAIAVVGKNDADTNVMDDTNPITDATHYVEVLAVKATSDVSSDGSYQWWVDGIDQGTVTGVDNYNIMTDQN